MNLYIRKLTAADRQQASCNLEGYWGIFEGNRVAAIDRDPAALEKILEDVHGEPGTDCEDCRVSNNKFPTRIQNTADVLDRLSRILDAADTGAGGTFPSYLAAHLMKTGKELEEITLGELQQIALTAAERADASAREVRALCAGY